MLNKKNIEYELSLIDFEIDNCYINEVFKLYMKGDITKSQLLDAHSKRNELFIKWNILFNYLY